MVSKHISSDNYFEARTLFAIPSGNIEKLLESETKANLSLNGSLIAQHKDLQKSIENIVNDWWKKKKKELAIDLKDCDFSSFLELEAKHNYALAKQIFSGDS